jgi:hypothetical protein
VNKKKNEINMLNKINSVLEPINAQVIRFDIYYEVFGNMILEIIMGNERHKFVTDKGEIFHNQHLVFDNSYHEAGKHDTFDYLLKAIKKVLVN